jgi:hypothetical protein
LEFPQKTLQPDTAQKPKMAIFLARFLDLLFLAIFNILLPAMGIEKLFMQINAVLKKTSLFLIK